MICDSSSNSNGTQPVQGGLRLGSVVHLIAITFLLCMGVSPVAHAQFDASEPDWVLNEQYPVLEDYQAEGDLEGYKREALKFLTERSKSRFAPRIALELFMLAEAEGDDDRADALRKLLIQRYPQQLNSAYVASTFNDETEFAGMVGEYLQEHLVDMTEEEAITAIRILQTGRQYWGDGVVDSAPLAIQLGIAGELAGQEKFVNTIRSQMLALKSPDTVQIAKAVLGLDNGTRLTPRQTVVALDPYLKYRHVRFMQRHFLRRTPANERSRPEVVHTLLRNLLLDEQYETAERIFSQYQPAERSEVEAAYWKALSLAGQGKHKSAQSHWQSLESKINERLAQPSGASSEDRRELAEIRNVAAKWIDATNQLASNLQAHQTQIESALQFLQTQPIEQIELTLVWQVEPDKRSTKNVGSLFRLYLAADQDGRYELIVLRDRREVIRFLVEEGRGNLFTAGYSVRSVFSEIDQYPMFTLDLNFADDELEVNPRLDEGTTQSNAVDAFKQVLANMETDSTTVRQLLVGLIRNGKLPGELVPVSNTTADPERIKMSWLRPDVNRPERSVWPMRMSLTDDLLEVNNILYEGVLVQSFKAGKKFELKPLSQDVSEMPERSVARMTSSEAQRLIDALLDLPEPIQQ